MEKLLVVDDDLELCELLQEYLAPEGYELTSVHDGKEGLNTALTGTFDLVVLDVMLPNMNGFDILRALRGKSSIPVLMLTARGEEVDRIVGLEIGADDYLPKPFNPRELVARIKAILRRSQTNAEVTTSVTDSDSEVKVGDVVLHSGSMRVTRAGKEVDLTAVEFKILEILLRNAGGIVKRDNLAEDVLGRELAPFDRSIDVHISNLRRKLGREYNGFERIRTIRGSGYIYTVST